MSKMRFPAHPVVILTIASALVVPATLALLASPVEAQSAQTALTKLNAKFDQGRGRAGTVWTGTEVYIFGGHGADGRNLDDIYRYTPGTDTLTKMTAKLPEARAYTTAAWANGKAYVIGGGIDGANRILRYDPPTDTATRMTASLPDNLHDAAAAFDGQFVYVIGGCIATECPTAKIWRFDPATDSLTLTSYTLPIPARHHAIATSGSTLYITVPDGTGGNDMLRFVPSQGIAPVKIGEVPAFHSEPVAFFANDHVYVVGGFHEKSISRFTVATGASTSMASRLSDGRGWAAGAWTGTQAFIFGGTTGTSGYFNDTLRYTPSQDTLANTAPIATFSTTTRTDSLTVKFDASASRDPDGTITKYEWTFGDGTRVTCTASSCSPATAVEPGATGAILQHTYASASTYRVFLTVTDNGGETATHAGDVIANRQPNGAFRVDVSNMTVHVDASASSDPDNNIEKYTWDWGDGTPRSTGVLASHTYAGRGTYTIKLSVEDKFGLGSHPTRQVTLPQDASIPNQPPTARFTYRTQPDAPMPTAFVDARASSDPDGRIMLYEWHWGDGTRGNATFPETSHAYATPGTYSITLIVTDDKGARGAVTETVSLGSANEAPVARFQPRVNGMHVDVDGRDSFDPDGRISGYTWDWGDGTPPSRGALASHAYATPGPRTITLTVVDEKGATGSASHRVNIESSRDPPNMPPVPDFRFALVNTLTVEVDASASIDPDGRIVRYAWDWGDGTAASTGVSATHTFSVQTMHQVTLTVTDDKGATASKTQWVGNPTPPTVHASPPTAPSYLLPLPAAAWAMICLAGVALAVRRRA